MDDFPIVEVLPVLEKAIKSPLYRNTVSLLLGILSGAELGTITVLQAWTSTIHWTVDPLIHMVA